MVISFALNPEYIQSVNLTEVAAPAFVCRSFRNFVVLNVRSLIMLYSFSDGSLRPFSPSTVQDPIASIDPFPSNTAILNGE